MSPVLSDSERYPVERERLRRYEDTRYDNTEQADRSVKRSFRRESPEPVEQRSSRRRY